MKLCSNSDVFYENLSCHPNTDQFDDMHTSFCTPCTPSHSSGNISYSVKLKNIP